MNKQIKSKKSLGQNFLIDTEALSDIASSFDMTGKHIIEVGPGYGALTEYIISHHPQTLDLVELDEDMITILEGVYGLSQAQSDATTITLHHQDILTFIPNYEEYSVIANIPYYITSPILFHFLYPETLFAKRDGTKGQGDLVSENAGSNLPPPRSSAPPVEMRFTSPQEMTIMMQEEVGEKILAGRNKKPHHSYLSLAMELACESIEIVRSVGRESFDPVPNVDSIVLQFTVKSGRNRQTEERLLALWRIAFTHPRKTLLSNLRGSHYDIEHVKLWLRECGYDEKIRAEAVGMGEWGKLLSICIPLFIMDPFL